VIRLPLLSEYRGETPHGRCAHEAGVAQRAKSVHRGIHRGLASHHVGENIQRFLHVVRGELRRTVQPHHVGVAESGVLIAGDARAAACRLVVAPFAPRAMREQRLPSTRLDLLAGGGSALVA
jgi:hypothetical protein